MGGTDQLRTAEPSFATLAPIVLSGMRPLRRGARQRRFPSSDSRESALSMRQMGFDLAAHHMLVGAALTGSIVEPLKDGDTMSFQPLLRVDLSNPISPQLASQLWSARCMTRDITQRRTRSQKY